jgi:FEZ-like protein
LDELSVPELAQILADVETLVRDLSEELVQDLGIRDELEFEKVFEQTIKGNNYRIMASEMSLNLVFEQTFGGTSAGSWHQRLAGV